MKRSFFIIVASIFAITFFNNALQIVQDNSSIARADLWAPCEPDCPDDKFEDGGPQTHSFILGGCEYKIDFYYRKACDFYCDFNIYRIRLVDPGCNDAYSVDFLLDYAMIELIKNSGFGDCQPPGLNTCTTNWRVNNAGCMFRQTNEWTGEGPAPSYHNYQVIFPCSGSVCCFRTFQTCIDQWGNYTVTPTSSSSSGTCPQTYNGETCYDTCN